MTFAFLSLSFWHSFRTARIKEEKEIAVAIEKFHQRLNDKDFIKICEEAYGCSDSNIVREGWNSVLQKVWDRAGRFQAVKNSDIRVYIEPPSLHATYISSFEKSDVKEIFLLRRTADGTIRIVSYQTVTKELPVVTEMEVLPARPHQSMPEAVLKFS